ncbi:MAG: AAA family ATPase [Sneathiellales bacterium]|nr:AAA family ATPase [Sneathiellales bacterium]
MSIISILNPKGGSGKTTLSTNLASFYHERGFKTLLVDTDPQGSASDWHAAREDNPLPFVAYGKAENLKALPDIAKPYDYVIIDGAAKLEGMIAAAIKITDVILIPVQPSPLDIWATSDLVELIRARQEVTEGKPKAAFVVSRAIKNTLLSQEIVGVLADFELPVFETFMTQRQAYPRTASLGASVHNGITTLKARQEVNSIIDELEQLIGGKGVRHVA